MKNKNITLLIAMIFLMAILPMVSATTLKTFSIPSASAGNGVYMRSPTSTLYVLNASTTGASGAGGAGKCTITVY